MLTSNINNLRFEKYLYIKNKIKSFIINLINIYYSFVI